MAAGEITGATREEVQELRAEHEGANLYVNHDIPFRTAFCLRVIGKQPDEYDGPQRYCKQRASKLTDEEWAEKYDDEYDNRDERSYCPFCRFHFRDTTTSPDGNPEYLLEAGMAPLKHGMYAENFRLAADFSEEDALMFDYIMGWADIYGWPDREDDPARYDLLEQFAYDRVRSLRSEEYFEEVAEENDGQSQIEYRQEYDNQGMVIGEYPVPNALSEDLRLLRKDLRDQMKEMGLTPKARGEMDAMESQASAHEAIGELAQKAVSGDHEYDPSQFDESGDAEPDEVADADAEEPDDDTET